MKHGFNALGGLVATWCCGAALVLSQVLPLARGQDWVPAPPPLSLGRIRDPLVIERSGNVMILSNLPHVGRLFSATCNGPTCCEEMLQQVQAHAQPSAQPTRFLARFLHLGCPACAVGECTCTKEATCGSECLAASCGSGCKCCACSAKSEEARCGDESCEVETVVVNHASHHEASGEPSVHQLMEHIAGLMADKAAAEARLEAQAAAHEKISEIFEAMAEVLADNAALDAKVEAQAEHLKLVEKLGELAVENARLKTHVELAAQRTEAAQSTVALAIENERLKSRLAELEQKHATDAARTAGRSRSEKRAR